MNNITNSHGSEDFCSDPNAVVADASLVDLLSPCPQNAFIAPVFVVIQMFFFIAAGFWRERWMRRAGIEEDDIQMILSSRRNPVCLDSDSKLDEEDGEKETSHQTVESDSKSQKEDVKSVDEEMAAPDTGKHAADEEPVNQDTTKDDVGAVPVVEGNGETTSATITPPPVNETTGVRRFDLQYLLQEYGDKKLRRFDSIPRKTAHFLSGSCLMLQLQFTTKTYVSYIQAGFFGAVIVTAIFISCWACFPDSWIATRVYSGLARIRDGKFGRVNVVTAYTGFTIGAFVNYILAIVAILPHLQHPSLQMLIPPLTYTPLAVGDALGELIGGPYGGTFFPTFQVKGMGEINRKSVEGCSAVFGGSFVSCCIVCLMFGATSGSWILLSLCLAIVTTIVETIAFRSTDNFCIPLANTLVLMLAFGVFGEHFS